MAPHGPDVSPGVAGRRFLATATVVATLLGILGDARWFAASGAFGVAWWGWDFLWDSVVGPIGGWFAADLSVDDTIRLLEDHLAADAVPRHVQIESALRLAEIYRLSRHDPLRAEAVLARVRARWPDAPELAQRQPPAVGKK